MPMEVITPGEEFKEAYEFNTQAYVRAPETSKTSLMSKLKKMTYLVAASASVVSIGVAANSALSNDTADNAGENVTVISETEEGSQSETELTEETVSEILNELLNQ